MKKILIICAMITALTMTAWGDIPFNNANAATATTEEVTEEQPAATDEETVVEEEEVIVEDEQPVIEDDKDADQGDVETKPAE
jgi:hypothetical protein